MPLLLFCYHNLAVIAEKMGPQSGIHWMTVSLFRQWFLGLSGGDTMLSMYEAWDSIPWTSKTKQQKH